MCYGKYLLARMLGIIRRHPRNPRIYQITLPFGYNEITGYFKLRSGPSDFLMALGITETSSKGETSTDITSFLRDISRLEQVQPTPFLLGFQKIQLYLDGETRMVHSRQCIFN